jgi:hypothetical protein
LKLIAIFSKLMSFHQISWDNSIWTTCHWNDVANCVQKLLLMFLAYYDTFPTKI